MGAVGGGRRSGPSVIILIFSLIDMLAARMIVCRDECTGKEQQERKGQIMTETPIQETTSEDSAAAVAPQPPKGREKKRWFVVVILVIIAVALAAALTLLTIEGVRKLRENPDFSWTSRNMIAIYFTAGIIAFFVVFPIVSRTFKQKSNPKHLAYWLCFAILVMTGFWTWSAISTMRLSPDFSYDDPQAIALYFASGIAGFAILAFVALMRRATTRWEMEQRLHNDKDIHDWLVIFNWTKKILHIPTVVCAFLAAFIVSLYPEWGKTVGAAWFCVWLFCHIIEDNNIGLAVAIAIFVAVVLFVALAVFGGVLGVIGEFIAKRIHITASPALYIGFGLAYLASIAMSYIKGLFYYVALEPNQMIVQFKIGEDGETFQRMQYDARVEATVDIFEWFFFDMATIKIQFRDGKRSPMEFYVGRIKKKAGWLSAVLGVTAIDRAERIDRPNSTA